MSDDPKDDVNQDSMADDWAAAMEQQTSEDEAGQSEADAVEFDEFDMAGSVDNHMGSPELEVILDIPVSISMEVGRTSITIRNLLQLNQGSVIELDRLAGEPLDVLVNGTLIAHGEVVVVNEKFGIRMTDVISQSERIKKLR
ncbi:MAG: flagellar motor switch protein FliN [Alteromonadaceae bacterium]|nr:MAG: flagellar motor switch protein FliN [Alteromonadaceae bacterium]